MSRRLMLRNASGGGGILPPYSQDGLVFWLDGIFNTANGHDDFAAVWEDLSGNGHGYIYSSGNEIGNKYLRTNAEGNILQTAFSSEELALIQSVDATFEIVISPSGLSQNTCIIPHGNNRSSVTLYSGSILFGARNAYLSLGLLSGVHSYNSKSFVDGSVASNTAKKDSWTYNTPQGLFRYNSENGRYAFNGDVYAIRLYSRQLSDAEIAAHWSLDQSRFGIEV